MSGNYSLDGLADRAAAAKDAHAGRLSDTLALYEGRTDHRRRRGIPAFGFCGMGRAGKDTAAEYVCAHTDAVYPRSASWQALPFIAHMIGVSEEEAWNSRHQNREFWIAACHAFRGSDYTLLVRLCLSAGDVAVGIRGRLELAAAVRTGVVDLTLWVDNPRVPKDVTVEYGPEDCDIVVTNHGSITEFYAKLHRLVRAVYPA